MSKPAPGPAGPTAPPAWQRLEGDLPPLPDPAEDADLVWQQLRASLRMYHRAATRARLGFQTLKTASLVVAASVPVVAAVSAPAGLTAGLAAVVVVLEGVLQLFQLQPHYISYRDTAEILRQHGFMYAGRVGPYTDPATRRDLLADLIQRAVGAERDQWNTAMRRLAVTPPGPAG